VTAFEPASEELVDAVVRYAVDRIRLDPPPLDHSRPEAELRAAAGPTVTPKGIGGLEALRVFADILAPAAISIDHPLFLSFVPAAPTDASVLFDLVVGASSLYAGSWLEGAGAVYAENEALRWLADLAGMPDSAGGVFVSGGTGANLSALVAARHHWRYKHPGHDRERAVIVASAGAHSSVKAAARVMDADVFTVAADGVGRMHGDAARDALTHAPADVLSRAFVLVATAGTTNVGSVDDLGGLGAVAEEYGLWFHVDGAYGGAALAAPSVRARYDGVERADSFVVDPHKWLFAPFDCAALLYRDPAIARAAHTQHAEYLEVLTERPEWNASDYAFHLSRRARGLPFWFSLATYGTDAYRDAIETCIATARAAADLVREADNLELVCEPELSVVAFRRLGWDEDDYRAWSLAMLTSGQALLVPSAHDGETILRLCVVNPRTTVDDMTMIVASLR
jgi:L-2,4-diaminobutyrate decarboxylase